MYQGPQDHILRYLCDIYLFIYLLQIGIIGGSGLDNPDILEDRAEKHVKTPFGDVRCSVESSGSN